MRQIKLEKNDNLRSAFTFCLSSKYIYVFTSHLKGTMKRAPNVKMQIFEEENAHVIDERLLMTKLFDQFSDLCLNT